MEELVAIIEDPGDVRLPPLAREATLALWLSSSMSAHGPIKQLVGDAFGLAPIQPGEPPACDDPRRRCHHRDRRWSRRSEMARSFARAGSSRPGSVWCPDNTRVAARTGWGGSRSAGMAISGACSCMVREACCAGAAPSRARGLAGPTSSWRGGRQTSCWSPWPIRQPASPGHCSDTSVSTDRRPPDQLESGYKLARVTTI